MRDLAGSILSLINKRQGVTTRTLFWIKAKNRETGAPETIGVWSGADTRIFTINGEARTYIGGGGFVQMGDLTQEQGLNVNKLTAECNAISPEFVAVIKQYDSRMAPVQVHIAFFDPETNQLVANPVRVFKGWINTAPTQRAAKDDGNSSLTLNMVGNARLLTKVLGIKRSHENQKTRLAHDTFLQYVAMTGAIQTPWGSKTV